MEEEGPVGEEFESLVRLVVDYRQPRLEALDPKNHINGDTLHYTTPISA